MARPAVARVASIMLDCNDLDAMVSFWGRILDVKEKNRFPGYVWMTRISRGGPALAFQQVSEKKAAKNRLHLDLKGHLALRDSALLDCVPPCLLGGFASSFAFSKTHLACPQHTETPSHLCGLGIHDDFQAPLPGLGEANSGPT